MRCPFRMKAFDQPDTCDPECAWLVVTDAGCGRCAVTMLAVMDYREKHSFRSTLHTNSVKVERSRG